MMLHPTHELEPPANKARFKPAHSNIRLKNGANPANLARNQLDSVTSEWTAGTSNRDRIKYRPFGQFWENTVVADREDGNPVQFTCHTDAGERCINN